MKKLILLLVVSFFVGKNCEAQTWSPTGAKWTFGIAYEFSPHIEYREWICTGDTMVGSHLCRLIKRNGNYVSGDITDKLITYEDSNKIYWYNINQFTTLYDFNKNAGETWTIMTDTCALLITVDSTGIDTINGVALKSLYISSEDWSFSGKVLEHIGNLTLPNPNIIFHCTGAIEDYNYYTGLRCYEDDSLGFHSFSIAPSCDYVSNQINEIKTENNFNLYPNPATNQLTLESAKAINTIEITDDLGRVQSFKFKGQRPSTPINIHALASGIYFVKLYFGDGGMEVKKFVKE